MFLLYNRIKAFPMRWLKNFKKNVLTSKLYNNCAIHTTGTSVHRQLYEARVKPQLCKSLPLVFGKEKTLGASSGS